MKIPKKLILPPASPSSARRVIELDPKGYLFIKVVGNTDEADALSIKQEVEAIFSSYPGKRFSAIVDITPTGITTAKAVRIYGDLMQNPQYDKFAFIDGGAMTKVFVRLVENFAHAGNIRYFDTRAEAEAWIL